MISWRKFHLMQHNSLFPSWRIASLFREIPESEFILEFSTPWPKRRFGRRGAGIELSSYYEEAIVLNTIARFCLYLLVSLLHANIFLQDLFFQLLNDSSLGYVLYLMILLFKINPKLPFLFVFLVIGFVSIMLRSARPNELYLAVRPTERHLSESIDRMSVSSVDDDALILLSEESTNFEVESGIELSQSDDSNLFDDLNQTQMDEVSWDSDEFSFVVRGNY
jgi:hypothetical protein